MLTHTHAHMDRHEWVRTQVLKSFNIFFSTRLIVSVSAVGCQKAKERKKKYLSVFTACASVSVWVTSDEQVK